MVQISLSYSFTFHNQEVDFQSQVLNIHRPDGEKQKKSNHIFKELLVAVVSTKQTNLIRFFPKLAQNMQSVQIYETDLAVPVLTI